MFSKSFGYALRGMLYIALIQDEERRVQVDEISSELNIPRHFMGKILKKLVKSGMLGSTKGPYGGFYMNERTLSTSVLDILRVTDGTALFENCSLRLQECNPDRPCPMHDRMVSIKNELKVALEDARIKDLILGNRKEFIQSISTLINHVDIKCINP